jgi:hypothetical protein
MEPSWRSLRPGPTTDNIAIQSLCIMSRQQSFTCNHKTFSILKNRVDVASCIMYRHKSLTYTQRTFSALGSRVDLAKSLSYCCFFTYRFSDAKNLPKTCIIRLDLDNAIGVIEMTKVLYAYR